MRSPVSSRVRLTLPMGTPFFFFRCVTHASVADTIRNSDWARFLQIAEELDTFPQKTNGTGVAGRRCTVVVVVGTLSWCHEIQTANAPCGLYSGTQLPKIVVGRTAKTKVLDTLRKYRVALYGHTQRNDQRGQSALWGLLLPGWFAAGS